VQWFNITTLILIVLAGVGGFLVYDFIRQAEGRSGIAVIGAVIGHILFLGFLSLDLEGLGCGVTLGESEWLEFDVAELPPPPPERKKPEKKKELPPPEEKKDEPPPDKPAEPQRARKVKPAPEKRDPIPDEPPPPMRFDASNTVQGGTSGVVVQQGDQGGVPEGTGEKKSKGKGSRPPGEETDEGGDTWTPRSELFIRRLPDPIKVPKIQCKQAIDEGLEGTVVLKVQIRGDGTVRRVTVKQGMHNSCDAIARKALRKAKFKPAIATNGKTVDYELRYEYAFRLAN
jgi:protein TonB